MSCLRASCVGVVLFAVLQVCGAYTTPAMTLVPDQFQVVAIFPAPCTCTVGYALAVSQGSASVYLLGPHAYTQFINEATVPHTPNATLPWNVGNCNANTRVCDVPTFAIDSAADLSGGYPLHLVVVNEQPQTVVTTLAFAGSCSAAKCGGCGTDFQLQAGSHNPYCAQCNNNRYGYYCRACEPCGPHGTCQGGLGGDGSCHCDSGWRGGECEQCDASVFCHGRGRCTVAAKTGQVKCQCDTHWGGTSCSQCQADGACSGHGRCNNDRTQCSCNPGWSGEVCTSCNPLYACNGRGYCTSGSDDDYAGDDDAAIATPQQQRSVEPPCHCMKSWTGPECRACTLAPQAQFANVTLSLSECLHREQCLNSEPSKCTVLTDTCSDASALKPLAAVTIVAGDIVSLRPSNHSVCDTQCSVCGNRVCCSYLTSLDGTPGGLSESCVEQLPVNGSALHTFFVPYTSRVEGVGYATLTYIKCMLAVQAPPQHATSNPGGNEFLDLVPWWGWVLIAVAGLFMCVAGLVLCRRQRAHSHSADGHMDARGSALSLPGAGAGMFTAYGGGGGGANTPYRALAGTGDTPGSSGQLSRRASSSYMQGNPHLETRQDIFEVYMPEVSSGDEEDEDEVVGTHHGDAGTDLVSPPRPKTLDFAVSPPSSAEGWSRPARPPSRTPGSASTSGAARASILSLQDGQLGHDAGW